MAFKMSWKLLDVLALKRRAYFLIFGIVIGSVNLAFASEINPIEAGQSLEKMGIVGIMTVLLFMMAGALGYVIKLMATSFIKLIKESTESNEHILAATKELIATNKEVVKTIEHCKTFK